ncbi:MAG: hypothetical protein ABSF91_12270 [Bacteroidota bacterium]|jgi:ppGpp synthetase/RelA/SpoT-type nucleotidyltranferase
MDSGVRDVILHEYDEKIHLYAAFTEKVKHLIVEILKEKDFHVHSVTSRVKERSSLAKKIERLDANYAKLADITDIAGIRITTYFSDEVDQISSVIEQEFLVDRVNTVDKRLQMAPDRFGYLSVHYVVQLAVGRTGLVEYKRFPDFKAEIQMRSLLQHAWAEIEHDLGYKTSQGVPRDIRRRFSRLAGLLELADEEFVVIRKHINRYMKEVADKIAKVPEKVTIDRDSLLSYTKNSSLVKELDRKLADENGRTLTPASAGHVEDLGEWLIALGIETINELEESLQKHRDLLLAFAEKWIGEKGGEFSGGICFFYLCYVLLAEKYDEKDITEYLTKFRIGVLSDPNLGGKVKSTYEEIRK